jgi:addiction module HigA family antidote
MRIELAEESWPDVAIPPGELLAETLEALNLTQADLAARMGRPVQAINEIIKGKKEITPESALAIERVLGTPAYIWVNLERGYRLNLARLADLARTEKEAQYLKGFPYKELAGLGWVKETPNRRERVEEMMRFFGVASLEMIPLVQAAAYRRSTGRRTSPGALAAWLRRGEIEAQSLETASFIPSGLRSLLPEIRHMTCDRSSAMEERLCGLCAKVGVAVVIVPHLSGTYVQGAARWLTPNRALVQLSRRYKYADIFWFTFFHEIGHLLRHGKRETFVDIEKMTKTEEEQEADRFAANTLISSRQFETFKTRGLYSEAAIRAFARQVGVAAGIVVGRLQHEGLLPATHLNRLRVKFT